MISPFSKFLGSLILVGALLVGCAGPEVPAQAPKGEGLKVVTSFYPMYEFTKQVGGDKVSVVNLVPAGSEPHDWEPTPQDMVTVGQADLLIYNGAGFEGWVEKVAKGADNPKLVLVETSKGLDLIPSEGDGHDHGEDGPGLGADSEGAWDPHVWLDPLLAKAQVFAIRDALIQADPANREVYEANAQAYGAKLDALDEEFRQTLSPLPAKELVTSHNAFAYLARRYGLTQVPIMGLAPDAEPKPKDMAEVVRFARDHQVRYIFFETLVNPKLAETLAREVGAETLVLNPVEGLTEEDLQQGRDYIAVMKENLANLQKALAR